MEALVEFYRQDRASARIILATHIPDATGQHCAGCGGVRSTAYPCILRICAATALKVPIVPSRLVQKKKNGKN